MIIDYDPDVVDFGDCLKQNLMHVDHCHVVEVLAQVFALEILMLPIVQVIHVDPVDVRRLMDFDSVLQVYLLLFQMKIK